MLNILDQKFMDWAAKNRYTFLLVMLLAGNVYQYIEGKSRDDKSAMTIETLNEKVRLQNEKALEYERDRTQRMEFLLNNLPKTAKTDEPKKDNAN